MILDNNSCLEFLKRNKEKLITKFKEKSPEDDDWEELYSLLNLENKLKYIFSKSVIETLDTIKVNLDFDCNILLSRKIKNGVYILDKNQMFLFNTVEEVLRVIYFKYYPKTDSSDVQMFSFYLKENRKVIAQEAENGNTTKFLRCCMYLEFLPIETKYIQPSEKFGTKKTGKIINKTKDEFIIVTKAWNQEYKTLPNTKYISRAHWGIRWTGKGRKIPKMTFIKASFKEMNKKPEKELKI